jgi:hypothetical protein
MPEKITYFAMVDDLSSRDAPAGVLPGPKTTRDSRTSGYVRP